MKKGFTIIELIVCVSIIALLATTISVSTVRARERSRDTKRLADLSQVQTALELYRSNLVNGEVPTPSSYGEGEIDGWDTSRVNQNGTGENWLDFLTQYLSRPPNDPYNNAEYFYRYQKFPANSLGCTGSFYVLQVEKFEAESDNHGFGACPDRDFLAENPDGFTVQIFE